MNTNLGLGNNFLSSKGKVDDSSIKSAKIIGIYFSAHWCPPCRGFTPKLAEFYNAVNKNEHCIEIVFVTHDKDESSFKEYFATMPWLALEFGDTNKGVLQGKYVSDGIPTLAILKNDGTLLFSDAYGEVGSKGASAFDEWLKK